MNVIRDFLKRVIETGAKREGSVKTVVMGRERIFDAYDIGEDTFIFQRGIASHLDERSSVLLVRKDDLRRPARGRVMTVSTGNHAVAAFPLLDGRFWRLSQLPSDQRSDVLTHRIVCANIVGETLEISQREVKTACLVEADAWLLTSVGFALNDIVMAERDVTTIEHYRALGQEWRVKPLAWTTAEMRTALAASRKRIASKLHYYHSTRGVHLLSLAEFNRFAALAESDGDEFVKALRELVGIAEGNAVSFTRMPKYRGHHEIELFGIRRGMALKTIVPRLETLLSWIETGRVSRAEQIANIREIAAQYARQLSRPEFADEESPVFVDQIYMYVTGEVYSVSGEGSTPAFDDRRTALPGATFYGGIPSYHPGVDSRTRCIMQNLGSELSEGETLEYANVYELRGEGDEAPLGQGRTREVVYKTNRRPMERSLIEKQLALSLKGYGGYMLARVEAFKALGIALSRYRILRRLDESGRRVRDFYVRERCEGDPISAIPANYYTILDNPSVEDGYAVCAVARMMGDAAAQNMAMKKFDRKSESPLFGVGKEIYEFEYDIERKRPLPKRVSICSVRGSFGWRSFDQTEKNLKNFVAFYLKHYAHALRDFQRRHTLPMERLAEEFLVGFAARTHALAWQASVMRDKFTAFSPKLPKTFNFENGWRFVLWALEQQERLLPDLEKKFRQNVLGGGKR